MAKQAAKDGSGSDPFFTPDLFAFLVELEAHNDRTWFQANKDRYEAQARDPMLRFIAALGEPLQAISKHFDADPRPQGGSMFRIYRDTRFSKDKTPYKTHVAAQFRHRACSEGVHGPGFYLHLEPGGCFAGGGLWHPEPESLRQIRDHLVSHTKAWKTLRDSGLEIEGECLKRVPQGFSPEHPFAEDLKLKDFYTSTALTDRQVCSGDFLERVAGAFQVAAPLVAFLSKAMALPW
jgi:uncharacterized protein (TIGR02453 family)